MGDLSKFQSTPPHGGRLNIKQCVNGRISFNPRPRTGGDGIVEELAHAEIVSIHAPARGATPGLKE